MTAPLLFAAAGSWKIFHPLVGKVTKKVTEKNSSTLEGRTEIHPY